MTVTGVSTSTTTPLANSSIGLTTLNATATAKTAAASTTASIKK